VLLRADNLQGLSRGDVAHLVDELGVTVVIDLRTGEEVRLEGPGPLVRDGRVEIRHRSLYPEKGKLTDVMISKSDGENPAVQYYLRYLADRPDSIVGALEDIASGDGPVVVHCAAGKDRTGVVAAVLLGLVGVSHEEIAADYHVTAGAMAAFVDWLTVTYPEALDSMTSQPPEYLEAPHEAMTAFLEHIDDTYGSVEGLAAQLGVEPATVDRLRATLVE
jgi:protein tyrosine/serine phosphatase